MAIKPQHSDPNKGNKRVKPKQAGKIRYRDAESGRFVSKEYAKKNSNSVVIVRKGPGRDDGPGIKNDKMR